MRYQVKSDDLDEEVEADTPEAAVSKALENFQRRRKRFSLGAIIEVLSVGETTMRYSTAEALKKLGRLQ